MDERADEPRAPLRRGERFARRVTFDDASIRNFAALCGDHNPLHHDVHAASQSAFGSLIASGPHVTSLMMGLDATFLSGHGEALGLGFEFRFVKAVPAGAALNLEWTITDVAHKSSLAGNVVSVEGRAIDDAGVIYVTATGRNLVRERRPLPNAAAPTGAVAYWGNRGR